MFPSSIVAAMMGLEKRQVFEIPEADRQSVDVERLLG